MLGQYHIYNDLERKICEPKKGGNLQLPQQDNKKNATNKWFQITEEQMNSKNLKG